MNADNADFLTAFMQADDIAFDKLRCLLADLVANDAAHRSAADRA